MDLFSDKKGIQKLKLFLNKEEINQDGGTAFRYDGLCREHKVAAEKLPQCRICQEKGHNMFFCENSTKEFLSALTKDMPVEVEPNVGEVDYTQDPFPTFVPNSAPITVPTMSPSAVTNEPQFPKDNIPLLTLPSVDAPHARYTLISSSDVFPGLTLVDDLFVNPFNSKDVPRLHDDDSGTCGAHRVSKATLKLHFDKIIENFKKKNLRRSDLLTMVEEGLNESDVSPTFVMEYFANSLTAVAEYVAEKYGLEGETWCEESITFEDTECPPTKDRNRFHIYAKDAKRVIVTSVADVSLMKNTLAGESLILINFHETLLCEKCCIDLVTVFVKNHLFHLFSPLRSNDVAKSFFDALRHDASSKKIFCKHPMKFQKFVHENFEWSTSFYDLSGLHSANKDVLKKDIWCTDGLAQTVSPGSPYCHRAKYFSAISRMSEKALQHWEITTCMLFTWGKMKYIFATKRGFLFFSPHSGK